MRFIGLPNNEVQISALGLQKLIMIVKMKHHKVKETVYECYVWKLSKYQCPKCVILCVESQKYLCVFLSCNMNDKKDTRRQLHSIYVRGNLLLKSSGNAHKMLRKDYSRHIVLIYIVAMCGVTIRPLVIKKLKLLIIINLGIFWTFLEEIRFQNPWWF